MHVEFSVTIDKAADTTEYEIRANGEAFATIYDDGEVDFWVEDMSVSNKMRVLFAAWQEFERRDSWDDFSFTIEL